MKERFWRWRRGGRTGRALSAYLAVVLLTAIIGPGLVVHAADGDSSAVVAPVSPPEQVVTTTEEPPVEGNAVAEAPESVGGVETSVVLEVTPEAEAPSVTSDHGPLKENDYPIELPIIELPETGDLVVRKFEDLDEDGIRDEGEPMLGGWEFTACDMYGEVLATGVTDSNGWLRFTGLPVGEVTVVERLTDGWMNTTPLSQSTMVVAGQVATLRFGNVACVQTPETGTLMVHKFLDGNENGVLDSGEAKLSGWTFTVRDSEGVVVASGSTGSEGMLRLELLAGTYTVTETLPSGWRSTTGVARSFIIAGGLTTHVLFGNVEEPALPFTEVPRAFEEFLPFTGGDYALLFGAAMMTGLAGLALRRKPLDRV
ncbi:MAG: MSCRAMM family protein [Coriobacteriia bacterium]